MRILFQINKATQTFFKARIQINNVPHLKKICPVLWIGFLLMQLAWMTISARRFWWSDVNNFLSPINFEIIMDGLRRWVCKLRYKKKLLIQIHFISFRPKKSPLLWLNINLVMSIRKFRAKGEILCCSLDREMGDTP